MLRRTRGTGCVCAACSSKTKVQRWHRTVVPAGPRNHAEQYLRQTHFRRRRNKSALAKERKFQPATERTAMNGRDDRPVQILNQAVNIVRIEGQRILRVANSLMSAQATNVRPVQ